MKRILLLPIIIILLLSCSVQQRLNNLLKYNPQLITAVDSVTITGTDTFTTPGIHINATMPLPTRANKPTANSQQPTANINTQSSPLTANTDTATHKPSVLQFDGGRLLLSAGPNDSTLNIELLIDPDTITAQLEAVATVPRVNAVIKEKELSGGQNFLLWFGGIVIILLVLFVVLRIVLRFINPNKP